MKNNLLAGCALAALFSLPLINTPAFAADVAELVTNGSFYGDVRYRYETVDQDGPAPIVDDATATTLRTRAGFKTGVYMDFQGGIEGDFVARLGDEDYNDGKNGKTNHPAIFDPQTTELNQLWAAWTGLPQTTVKLGRQAINLDNQRFVGTVGWRQNDQTFDAVVVENKTIDKLSLLYSFVGGVNRIFGHKHPQGDLDTRTHVAHATYSYAPWLNATAYGYWLDIDLAPASSSRTYGLRFNGEAPINEKWTFIYELEGARQNDHANNPNDYSESYYHVAPGLKWSGLTLQAGYESLGGNGTTAFSTPLATLHAFNGWADKFLATPANGLEDTYGRVSYKVAGVGKWIDNTVFDVVYHDFNADRGSNDFGNEWDLQVGRTFKTENSTYPFKEWSVSLKYADFDDEDVAAITDTQKFWFTIGTKF